MIELKIKISEIDYGGIAQQALPAALEKMRASRGDSKAIQALQGLGGLPAGAMKLMLKAMPQDARDSIALALLNAYRDDLSEQINRFAARKGVQLTVESIEAHKC